VPADAVTTSHYLLLIRKVELIIRKFLYFCQRAIRVERAAFGSLFGINPQTSLLCGQKEETS
jgi:hypothetical protein